MAAPTGGGVRRAAPGEEGPGPGGELRPLRRGPEEGERGRTGAGPVYPSSGPRGDLRAVPKTPFLRTSEPSRCFPWFSLKFQPQDWRAGKDWAASPSLQPYRDPPILEPFLPTPRILSHFFIVHDTPNFSTLPFVPFRCAGCHIAP